MGAILAVDSSLDKQSQERHPYKILTVVMISELIIRIDKWSFKCRGSFATDWIRTVDTKLFAWDQDLLFVSLTIEPQSTVRQRKQCTSHHLGS